jgi:excisionase family DNA binding protein
MSSNINIEKICCFCGKTFTAKTTTTKCCSDNCSKRLYKKKKRDEKINIALDETKSIRNKEQNNLNEKEFLSISEVSSLFNVSRITIWRLCKYGKLKSVKIGRSKFISKKHIDILFGVEQTSKAIIEINDENTTFLDRVDEYISLTDIYEKFNISSSAVYLLIKRNKIPKIKIGKEVFIKKHEVEKLFL